MKDITFWSGELRRRPHSIARLMSASLIGRVRSSAFRLSETAVSMSLAGYGIGTWALPVITDGAGSIKPVIKPSAPAHSSFSTRDGSARALARSRLIFCTISLGVLAGAKMPCHESTT